jgi:hypothetical protein
VKFVSNVFEVLKMSERIIRIIAGGVSAEAALRGNATADAIWNALPITGNGSTWGDEIYFTIPVKVAPAADASADVAAGDLAYWPPGSAFCIFFGRTPASTGPEPRAASAVNVFGRVRGDATVFKSVPDSASVRIEKA